MQSEATAKLDRARKHALTMASAAVLSLGLATGGSARAQTSADNATGSINLGARGGKENCFVLTGDLSATPGGSIDPLRNPEGLRSRWCSATFVAKFWFALN